MISSVLALAMAASMQPADTTRSAREAFTACLRTYVDHSVQARMAAAEFTTAYPQQCATQEAAFRAAVIRRETASRSSQADAQQSAVDEIDDARTNFRERFEMALAPTSGSSRAPAAQPAAATATAAAAPATAAGTPAVQQASQQTPAAQPAGSPH